MAFWYSKSLKLVEPYMVSTNFPFYHSILCTIHFNNTGLCPLPILTARSHCRAFAQLLPSTCDVFTLALNLSSVSVLLRKIIHLFPSPIPYLFWYRFVIDPSSFQKTCFILVRCFDWYLSLLDSLRERPVFLLTKFDICSTATVPKAWEVRSTYVWNDWA